MRKEGEIVKVFRIFMVVLKGFAHGKGVACE